MHTHMHTCLFDTHIHTHTNTYAHTQTHILTHAHTRTHTHTHTDRHRKAQMHTLLLILCSYEVFSGLLFFSEATISALAEILPRMPFSSHDCGHFICGMVVIHRKRDTHTLMIPQQVD